MNNDYSQQPGKSCITQESISYGPGLVFWKNKAYQCTNVTVTNAPADDRVAARVELLSRTEEATCKSIRRGGRDLTEVSFSNGEVYEFNPYAGTWTCIRDVHSDPLGIMQQLAMRLHYYATGAGPLVVSRTPQRRRQQLAIARRRKAAKAAGKARAAQR